MMAGARKLRPFSSLPRIFQDPSKYSARIPVRWAWKKRAAIHAVELPRRRAEKHLAGRSPRTTPAMASKRLHVGVLFRALPGRGPAGAERCDSRRSGIRSVDRGRSTCLRATGQENRGSAQVCTPKRARIARRNERKKSRFGVVGRPAVRMKRKKTPARDRRQRRGITGR